MTRFIANSTALVSALVLIACGGSSGGGGISGIDGSGAPVAVSTTGTIDGFGSVIVNGVRYNSDKAQILINGEIATEDNLQTGYQVSMTGKIADNGTATADKIEFTPNIIGAISRKNKNSLVVMDQVIKINNDTIFDVAISPRSILGLDPGTVILVSGSLAADGSISATRVELAKNARQQLVGFVNELNSVNMTFVLNHQRVSYAGANLDLGSRNLRNGLLISARGTLGDNQLLQATQVKAIATEFSAGISSASVEGYVTRFVSTTDFDVAGIHVTTNAQTRYENGNAGNLAMELAVEVEGKVDGNGKLLANKIEFERKINNRIAGKVTGINTLSDTGIITGILEVEGSSIRTTVSTRYEDKGRSRVKRFNFSSLQIGDFVEVTGYSADAGFIATKIEREENQGTFNEREMTGVITGINGNVFKLFGREISTDGDTDFFDQDGNPLDAAAFFTVADGKRAKVFGTDFGDSFIAIRVELDGEK